MHTIHLLNDELRQFSKKQDQFILYTKELLSAFLLGEILAIAGAEAVLIFLTFRMTQGVKKRKEEKKE